VKRAVAVVAILALALAALWLARHRRSRAGHPRSASTSDLGNVRGATNRARPAPPLRLPSATAVEDGKSVGAEFAGRVLSTANSKPIARASLTFLH
jgi:hypothetical protein